MSGGYIMPEQQIRQRYNWFQEAQRVETVTLAGSHLGISRKTFYKWKKRFDQAHGERSALLDRSRRPHRPKRHDKKGLTRRILTLRQQNHLGPQRIRQLLQNHGHKKITFAPNPKQKRPGP